MSAPLIFPSSFAGTVAALDHADRATRTMLARLTYAQDTSVTRQVVAIDGQRHAAIAVGLRYVLWPEPPAAMRFGRVQTVEAGTCRWHLGLRGSGGATPELAVIGRHDGLKAALTALVRELLADRFLPMRHRTAAAPSPTSAPPLVAVAHGEPDQTSRSMWWLWR